MKNETAKSADYKLVKYRDSKTGKIKFRKMRHNDKIVKQQDVEEKAVSKAQQKFFGMVRAKQKGEMPNASPEVKKAAASMSKKDVKDFAATKHKDLPAKKEGFAVKYNNPGHEKHGRGKHVGEEVSASPRDTNVLKTYEDFKSDLAKRKAANLAKRGARRGPAKGTAKKDGDWDQKTAKPLGFEIKSNDHHSTVHKTLAKAADAMHPSLGGRKVSLKVGGKTKVYSNHKDLQHVVDYHSKLKDKGQKADLMRSVRSGGHDAISKHTGVYRKVTKQ